MYLDVFVPRCEDEQEEIRCLLRQPCPGRGSERVPVPEHRSGDLIPTEIRKMGYTEKRAEYERRIAAICLKCSKDNCPGKCPDFTRRANGIYKEIYGHKPNKVF